MIMLSKVATNIIFFKDFSKILLVDGCHDEEGKPILIGLFFHPIAILLFL